MIVREMSTAASLLHSEVIGLSDYRMRPGWFTGPTEERVKG